MSDEERAPVQYVLVRKDMPVAVQMVHVGHACGESVRVAPISKRTVIRLLHVENQGELLDYAARIVGKGFYGALVEEDGGPYHGQAVSFATEPLADRQSAMGKLVWHLKRVEFVESIAAVVP